MTRSGRPLRTPAPSADLTKEEIEELEADGEGRDVPGREVVRCRGDPRLGPTAGYTVPGFTVLGSTAGYT
jgi:hypothetical protein